MGSDAPTHFVAMSLKVRYNLPAPVAQPKQPIFDVVAASPDTADSHPTFMRLNWSATETAASGSTRSRRPERVR